MLTTTCRRLSQALQRPHALSAVAQRCLRAPGARSYADQNEKAEQPRTFHPALLQFLVCPLSKKPLRYDASTNELINDELGIAYPIIDGVPNMIPQAARTTRQKEKQEETKQH
ncbi:similar to RIKEN cDNA 2610022G08, isoform CRA_a [Rattus norvegicus]|uniref:Protein preY, mitochondrial n=2 Tax=Rattus norvegicus TaxID=10116 RepID=PREY_RAT|nr:protein preY, mitochondrial precursor [Rattus norvegicus]Q5U1Z8.1 RecName: Full=Protein preY, mitochondrial; Flags: Precursor [Rattus norvegicus]AAH86361.1 Phosphatidylinositol glycan anchor biosynthesis, class Y [Rattus norvegicus]EDL88035.1 similar to RIKEN cDNA 2610022G08, isoform CRA_a [Rattus norvegicus]|eukprot:NP_001019541.1 protein preY, mitochondrial precursor [Rattus norvegicus]